MKKEKICKLHNSPSCENCFDALKDDPGETQKDELQRADDLIGHDVSGCESVSLASLQKDEIEEIKKIGKDVEDEMQMAGLSSGLYMDFAKEVAIRHGKQCEEREQERIKEFLKKAEIAEDKIGTFKAGHDCLKEQMLYALTPKDPTNSK